MQVAVIGGGVIGVCTAYFLADAGHEVVVIERYGNVAQENSFGYAGLLAPGFLGPWAAPGMPRKILSHLLKPTAPVLCRASFNLKLWHWTRQWLRECELDRYRVNRARLQGLGLYSQQLMRGLHERHELEDERTTGLLQLFREQRDLQLAAPGLELLAEAGIAHRLLDAEEARRIEPALADHTPLAGALHLPQDQAGNCPLFVRQMKNLAQAMGVTFHFNSEVSAIASEGERVSVRIDQRQFVADAVVIAAGAESARLLEPFGLRMPFCRVKTYSATAFIKDFEASPRSAVVDDTYNVVVARMGSRVRIAGAPEIGSRDNAMNAAALRTLVQTGEDWFPQATNYSAATFWSGEQTVLPDSVPLLGATPIRNIFVSVGQGSAAWTLAAGSGKILADLISGHQPEIDIEGLRLARYG